MTTKLTAARLAGSTDALWYVVAGLVGVAQVGGAA
jgi:hypothetical protein